MSPLQQLEHAQRQRDAARYALSLIPHVAASPIGKMVMRIMAEGLLEDGQRAVRRAVVRVAASAVAWAVVAILAALGLYTLVLTWLGLASIHL